MMSEYLGKDTFKLGFGLMRLPKLPESFPTAQPTSRRSVRW